MLNNRSNTVTGVRRIMSDYEEFFVTGDRCGEQNASNGLEQADYEVLRNKKGDLQIIVMNPAKGDRKFSFTLKGNQPRA